MSSLSSKRAVMSWCLYDWANSAFAAVIVTFVYAIYFKDGIVGDDVRGAALWGYTMGVSGLCIAFLAPLMGAIADFHGRRKPWIFVLSLICIAATAMLGFIEPGGQESYIWKAVILIAIANIAFELTIVFYNAMLGQLAPPERTGRISGLAWGTGYVGGIVCLAIVLFGFVGMGETDGFLWDLLGISKDNALHVRSSAPFVAVWFFIFMIPMFIWTPDKSGTKNSLGDALRQGLPRLRDSLRMAFHDRQILRFLIASMIYRDGLVTLFSVGAVYAGAVYGMDTAQVIQFGIGMNVTAGLGAIAFAHFDDRWGSKQVILIALIGLLVFGTAVLLAPTAFYFMIFAMLLGIFVGPVQAASRTMITRLAPKGQSAALYGLYALSGKSVSFAGPMIYSTLLLMTSVQQWAMATILVFWVVGLVLLLGLKDSDVVTHAD